MLGKWIKRGLLAVSALLTTAAIGPGCAETESSLFIRQVVFTVGPDCVARPEPDGLAVGVGAIDIALRDEYLGWLLLGNQLVARGSQDLIRSESNRMALKSAEVRVEDVNGNVMSEYTVPITGFLDQSEGTEPGFGVALVPLVDSRALANLQKTTPLGSSQKRLVSFIKVTGRTLGGSEVTSNEFQFVVLACKGCLVSFPPEADDPNQDGPDCLAPVEGGGVVDTDAPCSIGQDRLVNCQTCAGTNTFCRRPGGG